MASYSPFLTGTTLPHWVIFTPTLPHWVMISTITLTLPHWVIFTGTLTLPHWVMILICYYRMVPQSSALKNRSRKAGMFFKHVMYSMSHPFTYIYIYTMNYSAVAKYPDPLIGGMSSYQKRLCQLSILVSETVKHEKEKASQKAKKATGNGGGIKE